MYPSVRRVAYHAGNVLRDAAGSIDRAGMRLQGSIAYRETLCRHRRVQPLYNKAPKVAADAFIAPNASLIGNVELSGRTSVWYGASLRGDVSRVKIGAGTSVGDRVVINVPDFKRRVKDEHPDTVVGERCVIGHGAILQGCNIGDECVVEMGSIVNEGASMEKNSVLAPSSVLAPGERVPTGQLWSGSPVKFERLLTL